MSRVVVHVVGARPNFMKAAPVIRALAARGVAQQVVHTGQHYDAAMSDVFFTRPRPARAGPEPGRRVGQPRRADGGADGRARGGVRRPRAGARDRLRRRELDDRRGARRREDWRCRSRTSRPGLRSFDDSMPEEINRRVTDLLSDLLFVDEPGGRWTTWQRTGVDPAPVPLRRQPDDRHAAREPRPVRRRRRCRARLGLDGPYAVATMHRPANVDDPASAARVARMLRARSPSGCRWSCRSIPRGRPSLEAAGLVARRPAPGRSSRWATSTSCRWSGAPRSS